MAKNYMELWMQDNNIRFGEEFEIETGTFNPYHINSEYKIINSMDTCLIEPEGGLNMYYLDNGYSFFDDVTHWMKKPKPPKGADD